VSNSHDPAVIDDALKMTENRALWWAGSDWCVGSRFVGGASDYHGQRSAAASGLRAFAARQLLDP